VGETAVQAIELARRNRPKDRLTVRYVESSAGERLTLSPLLAQLRPFFLQQPIAIYLVGGAVRDALLGKPSYDLDFVVAKDAIKLAKRLGGFLGAPAYALDEERDTGRVVLEEAGTMLDIARFRGADLDADLRDRDFTLNAMALPATAVFSSSIIDPCNGQADMGAKRLRLTHPQAVSDDPIRALRGVRMALKFGLTIDDQTANQLTAAAPLLSRISNERIRDELFKLLQTAVPDQAIRQLANLNLLPRVLPTLASLADIDQSPPHHENVLEHTISVLRWLVVLENLLKQGEDTNGELNTLSVAIRPFAAQLNTHLERQVEREVNGRLLLRLGALFHDIGKGETQTVDENGRVRFLGHDKAGAKLAANRLHQLAVSNKSGKFVQTVVANHMRPLLLARDTAESLSGRAIHRYFRATKEAGLDVGLLALAAHLATYNGIGEADVWERLCKTISTLFDNFFNKHQETISPAPFVDGHDLMKTLAIAPGPEIGRLLRLIAEAQAAGEIQTREEAIQFALVSRQ
ncbi:MAG: HDIG domain-containing metalloprotein, partial [Chloroflexota bacterium]